MKITIEPTTPETSDDPYVIYPKVEITLDGDDYPLDVVAKHIRAALLVWGYHPETIAECLGEDQ